MKISLEKARNEELKELAKIYAEEFSKSPYNEPWTLKKAIFKMGELSKYCDIFKIIADNENVGFIALNPNHWCPGEFVFGEEMAIKSEYQNKGIGTQVFNQIFETYKKKGYKKFIGIANKKGRAINLYKRLGITESADNVIIERDL